MTRDGDRRASGSDEVVIRYDNVCKRFGSKVVLQDLNLDVRRGETLAIMGPSGIGKSVTLRHAVGLLRPDSGRVLVEGKDMSTIAQEDLVHLRRRMGYLFQSGALLNWMTVGENVELPLLEHRRNLPAGERREKVIEKLRLVEMEEAAHKYPAEISGGMKKRVGLIRTGWYGKADLLRLIQVAPVDVVSLCDVDSTMLSDAADLVATRQASKKRPRTYKDYREMLKEKDLDVALSYTNYR